MRKPHMPHAHVLEPIKTVLSWKPYRLISHDIELLYCAGEENIFGRFLDRQNNSIVYVLKQSPSRDLPKASYNSQYSIQSHIVVIIVIMSISAAVDCCRRASGEISGRERNG